MMKKLFTIAILLLLLLANEDASAQQDPKFNQYMFNPLGINPAYAGSREALSVVALYRNQWVGFDGAPVTQTFSIHGPFKQKKMGLGFQVTNDMIGPRNTISAEVDYAYRFRLLNGQMSLGLGLGVQYLTFDWNKIEYKDEGDVIPTYGLEQVVVPDADFGIFYHTNKFYAGLELAHLTEPRIVVSDSAVNGSNAYRQFRHLSLVVGRAFVLTDNLTLRPSILYKQAGLFQGMVDANVSILIDKKLWAGVTYRHGYGGVIILEYLMNKNVRLGYSFDYPFNNLRLSQGTSHELFLGLEFGLPKNKTVSPRYF
ncbi:MAG: type IX secretion system membrane protein PorP/SprF [Flavobacteriales bacterium]|nr:type IX secretion system membrane protein PorP/SprF [Flavobacteriales bacterium]